MNSWFRFFDVTNSTLVCHLESKKKQAHKFYLGIHKIFIKNYTQLAESVTLHSNCLMIYLYCFFLNFSSRFVNIFCHFYVLHVPTVCIVLLIKNMKKEDYIVPDNFCEILLILFWKDIYYHQIWFYSRTWQWDGQLLLDSEPFSNEQNLLLNSEQFCLDQKIHHDKVRL